MKMWKVLLTAVVALALAGQSSATIFEDFADASGWNAGVGPAATGGSITSDGDIASMNYAHSTAVGFDYIDFYTDSHSLKDWSGFDTVILKGVNVPVDPKIFVQFKVYAGAWAEFTFPQNGTPTDYTLKLNWEVGVPSLYNWGAMDWSNVLVVKIHTNGDISNTPTSGTVLVDDIILIPEPATLALLALGGLLMRRKRA